MTAPSELRKGYKHLADWIDQGMTPRAGIAFTDGDLRLAGLLCEAARDKTIKVLQEAVDEFNARGGVD